MIIRKKKIFSVGAFFAVTFMGVLFLIFSPLFGGKNGLQFSDDSFNRLAKGSSYFIPDVTKSVEKFKGKTFSASIKFDKSEDIEGVKKLFTMPGAKIDAKETELRIEGDLGTVLQSALIDANAMYKNEGEAVSKRYGYDEKKVMKNWWLAFTRIEKELKKDKRVDEAKIISDVTKKAIEPGYNFYKIDAQKVADHAGMLSGLLVFYVAYTMWWGYSIFYMFDGLGLSMKKAKVKKEA